VSKLHWENNFADLVLQAATPQGSTYAVLDLAQLGRDGFAARFSLPHPRNALPEWKTLGVFQDVASAQQCCTEHYTGRWQTIARVAANTVRDRMSAGWSLERALNTPARTTTGPRYQRFSIEQLQQIKASGIHYNVIWSRVKNGMPFEQAITTPANYKLRGHSRLSFFSAEQLQEMKASGIYPETIRYRMEKMGMPFKQAVTTPLRCQSKVFSIEQLREIKACGIRIRTVRQRVKNGMPFERAITLPPQPPSGPPKRSGIADAARAHGLEPSVVYNRLQLGWSLERALTTTTKVVTKLFSDAQLQQIKASGIHYNVVRQRVKKGIPFEQALFEQAITQLP